MTYEGLPSDWYLKLTGATPMIRGEAPLSERIPETLTARRPRGRVIIDSTRRSREKFWRTIFRDRFRWRACSTEGATSTTTSGCSNSTGTKFIGRSLCLWGGEGNLHPQSRAREGAGSPGPWGRSGNDPAGLYLRDRDQPVEQVPVPDWAFPPWPPVEKRNFRTPNALSRRSPGDHGDADRRFPT